MRVLDIGVCVSVFVINGDESDVRSILCVCACMYVCVRTCVYVSDEEQTSCWLIWIKAKTSLISTFHSDIWPELLSYTYTHTHTQNHAHTPIKAPKSIHRHKSICIYIHTHIYMLRISICQYIHYIEGGGKAAVSQFLWKAHSFIFTLYVCECFCVCVCVCVCVCNCVYGNHGPIHHVSHRKL